MSNFNCTRNAKLKAGTKVLCFLYRFVPERVSKRTGELKPAQNRSQILSGKVIVDGGHTLYVEVRYPSGAKKRKRFLHYEVTPEAEFDKGLTGV